MLSEKEYRDAVEKYGYGTFRVGMGAEAIQELLKNIDLEKDSEELRKALQESTGQKRARIIKRLEVVDALNWALRISSSATRSACSRRLWTP